MRAKVDQDACIGCGACVSICPEVFSFNDEGFAQAITESIPEEFHERVREAIENCPTEAISKIQEND